MAESAAALVDEVIPRVPVRQWVLSFPIPLRILFAAHPELLAPVLRIIHRVIAGFLLKQAGLKRSTADTGAVTLIQRFGSAANLNIHLHCLVLDGVYRRTESEPVFQEVRAPTGAEMQGLLEKIVARLMKMPTRLGTLVAEEGMTYLADRRCWACEPCRAEMRKPRRACARMRTASACMPGCAAASSSARNSNACAATSPVRRSPTSGLSAMARVTSCCN